MIQEAYNVPSEKSMAQGDSLRLAVVFPAGGVTALFGD